MTRRTAPCSKADARVRLAAARGFLEAAEAAHGDPDPAMSNVVATNAIHAAIAASDAICCSALGYRPQGQAHEEAVQHLDRIDRTASRALQRALRLKTPSSYGIAPINKRDQAMLLKQATVLIDAEAKRLG